MLEIVIFIGTCVNDPKCAPIFANSDLVAVLYDLMADKQEDDEIVLQITYTFFRCLQHETTRDVLLNQTQVVSYFVDLLYDKNEAIRKMADQTLDLVMEFDPEWANQIRLRKFQIYNAEWLQAVEAAGDFGGSRIQRVPSRPRASTVPCHRVARCVRGVRAAWQGRALGSDDGDFDGDALYDGRGVGGGGGYGARSTMYVDEDEDEDDEEDYGYAD